MTDAISPTPAVAQTSGSVVVPLEPTEAMIAALDAGLHENWPNARAMALGAWKAVLASCPEARSHQNLNTALGRMRFLLAEVEEGVPAICDSPLFASYEFASDFKIVVDAASQALAPLEGVEKPQGPLQLTEALVKEYRPTMDRDVLHSWAADAVSLLRSWSQGSSGKPDPHRTDGEVSPQWQPIETAPIDTTELVGLCGRKDVRLVWYFKPSSRTQGWRDQNGKPVNPTHWMPLPALPVSQSINPSTCGTEPSSGVVKPKAAPPHQAGDVSSQTEGGQ